MYRRRRGIPGKRPNLQLQERDLDILECLGRLGPLGTDLLAAHFWGDKVSDPARRRLRKLLDVKAVTAILVGSRSANLYALSRIGLEYLVGTRGELDGVRLHEPVRSAAGVAHGQLVAASRLYLAALADAGHGALLMWSGGRGREASDLGLTAAHIAPDGIARLRLGSDESATRNTGTALWECDCGTEGLELQRKFERYAAYYGHGHGGGTQVWVAATGGQRRLDTVARWAREAGLASRVRLFPAATLVERPATAPVPRVDRLGAACGTKGRG